MIYLSLTVFITLFFFLFFKYGILFRIKIKTLHLQKPQALPDGSFQKRMFNENYFDSEIIALEESSRRSAYKSSSVSTGTSFFDDSDMVSDYYLIIVYDKKLKTPLLTARYYFDKSVIAKCIHNRSQANNEFTSRILDLKKFKEHELFLSDRFSGNTSSSLYRSHRNYIFLLFYLEILKNNKNCKLILMARKERFEKLLTKYLRLGFDIIGSTTHKGKEHWILLGDLKKIKTERKTSLFTTLYLLIKL